MEQIGKAVGDTLQLTAWHSVSACNALSANSVCLSCADQCDHTQQQAVQPVDAMLVVSMDIGTAWQTVPARFATAVAVQPQLLVLTARVLALQVARWSP